MTRIGSLAKVVRSKNAGALHLTLDLLFEDEARFRRVWDSGVLTPRLIAALYGVSENQVTIFDYPAAWAIKITLERPHASGNPADNDIYGAQQHVPLLDVEVP